MKRVHDAMQNPHTLIDTLQGLGVRGIVPVGALAYQTYPTAAQAPLVLPSGVAEVDGPLRGMIAPNLLSLPYRLTHLNWAANFNAGISAAGNYVLRWKILDSNGVVRRVLRFQNPAKANSSVRFGQSAVANIMPIPLLPTVGVQLALAADSTTTTVGARAYATALLVQPQLNPALLTVAPSAVGAVLPTTAAGTALTASATPWTFGSYVQLSAGLATGVLVTAVIIASASVDSGQVALATGGGGSEVDWGIFGWAEPFGASLESSRYSLGAYPVYIPASTRIAARVRGIEASGTFAVGVEYIPLPIR